MMNIFNTKKTTRMHFQLKALVAAVAMTSTFSSIAEIIPSEQVIKDITMCHALIVKNTKN